MKATNTTALKNVVDLVMGQAPSSKDTNFKGRGTPFLKVGEFGPIRPVIREWTTNPLRMARRTDVLLCVVGTCGKINLGEECAIGRSVAAIRPHPSQIDQFYLYYFLMTLVERLRSDSVGAAQTVISKKMVETVQIPVPSLPEQQRIVGILDEAFAAIATATAYAEKNLANARELFESQLNVVFTNQGDHQSHAALDDLCAITHGFAFKGKNFAVDNDPNKPIVITPGNFTEEASLTFTDKNTKRFSGDPPQRFTFDVGDLVIVMTDLSSKMKILGKPAFIERPNVLHNQRIGKLIFKTDSLDPSFLYYFFQTTRFLEELKRTATGTMVKHTAPKRILSKVISFPGIARQRAIVEQLDILGTRTRSLGDLFRYKKEVLTELKQSILHQAFTDELTADPNAGNRTLSGVGV